MKTVRNVVASAILAALVFVLLRFVAIPTPFPDTTLSIYAAVVAFFAVLFGPAVGFVGGFLGNLLVDLTAGWGVWWTWVVVTGLYGLFVGLGCKGIDLEDGVFEKKEFIRFSIVCVISCMRNDRVTGCRRHPLQGICCVKGTEGIPDQGGLIWKEENL